MITLHTWNTPNGQKPAIMLEELGLTYDVVMVDIGKGDQHQPGFRKLSPNSKIPALVDGDVTLFESGAILMHLAEKHGQFLPTQGQARADALAWTFWQVGGLGPMMGQWGHFLRAEEKVPYAIERYLAESIRLLEVMEERLSANAHLAGNDYTIADMMIFPWLKGGYQFLSKATSDRLPALTATRAWIDTIDARPAVQAGLARLKPAV
ncbi:MAG: glutathione S-transferase N-terminal domain-containing protein [Devosiaceae bacterium]